MRSLPARLLDSAAHWPDACALKHGTNEISYADLADRAVSIAQWLEDAGLRPGDRVALITEASIDYVAVYYGILMAGGVAVALNAAARAQELLGWITHSAASVLYIDGHHPEAQEVLRRLAPSFRVLAANREKLERACEALPVGRHRKAGASFADVQLDSLAALIYTSGTTGRPKAVMLTHGNLAANVDSILGYLRLTAADSVLCVLPFYYSYGNSVLHTHLACGARIVVGPSLVYPHAVMQAMAGERVTGFAGVPSTFALLSARVQFERYDLSALRYITQAGGAMAPTLTKRLQSLLPGVNLFVMYGQTEASARLTYLPPHRLNDKLGSVGIPIDGVDVEIRAENGEAVQRGVAGEVWARGPNVMRGYWADPDATAAVLSGGWLRTGDIGRMDEDGFLFLEGRRSDIIKVGAHRVSPGDVESVIEELGVEQVAAVGVEDELLGQVIKVFIVAVPGALLDGNAVKAHCRARLATYKVPKFVEFVEALPRTSSGKIQRHLLTNKRSEKQSHEQTYSQS